VRAGAERKPHHAAVFFIIKKEQKKNKKNNKQDEKCRRLLFDILQMPICTGLRYLPSVIVEVTEICTRRKYDGNFSAFFRY
jgi:hypothetical protein